MAIGFNLSNKISGAKVYIDDVKTSAKEVKIVKIPNGGSVTVNLDYLLSTLPYRFDVGVAVVYNSELHILGSDVSGNTTKHYKWSSANPNWTEVSTLPYNFYGGSAVVYNNEIHLLGGAGGNTTKHYKWSSSNPNWTEVSTLPYDFKEGSAVVYNNEIHILGGANDNTTKHYKWSSSNPNWTEVSTLPYDFNGGSAVVYNGEIHILGGGIVSGPTDNYTKHYKWSSANPNWTEVSTLPYNGFRFGSAVVYNGEIHILGGGITSTPADTNTKHYKWSSANPNWTEVSTLPYGFRFGSAVVYNGEIHILGGGITSDQTKHYIIKGPVTTDKIVTSISY